MAYSKAEKRKILDELYPELEKGKGVNTVCKANKHFPSASNIDAWIKGLGEKELDKYTQARARGVHSAFEEITTIADECEPDRDAIAHAKLRIDSRKFAVSKLNPEKYGDRTNVDLKTEGTITLNINHVGKETLKPDDI